VTNFVTGWQNRKSNRGPDPLAAFPRKKFCDIRQTEGFSWPFDISEAPGRPRVTTRALCSAATGSDGAGKRNIVSPQGQDIGGRFAEVHIGTPVTTAEQSRSVWFLAYFQYFRDAVGINHAIIAVMQKQGPEGLNQLALPNRSERLYASIEETPGNSIRVSGAIRIIEDD
jgi:hypothetical protein